MATAWELPRASLVHVPVTAITLEDIEALRKSLLMAPGDEYVQLMQALQQKDAALWRWYAPNSWALVVLKVLTRGEERSLLIWHFVGEGILQQYAHDFAHSLDELARAAGASRIEALIHSKLLESETLGRQAEALGIKQSHTLIYREVPSKEESGDGGTD